jgi:hypothetical protein
LAEKACLLTNTLAYLFISPVMKNYITLMHGINAVKHLFSSILPEIL